MTETKILGTNDVVDVLNMRRDTNSKFHAAASLFV